MRRQGRESAAGNLILESDYPKTGYYPTPELWLTSPWREAWMMISAETVRYIKLGKGGGWERAALDGGKVYFGFQDAPHELSLTRDFDRIRQYLVDQGRHRAAAASDAREICEFYGLGENRLWVTFAREHLWWTFAADDLMWVGGNGTAHGERSRTAVGGWRNTDANGVPLKINSLSTRLTKVAGYRRTICNVEAQDYLLRRINGMAEPIVAEASQAKEAMLSVTEKALQSLHWEDFETLVDIIFARSGWNRVSALGGNQKLVDLELEQFVTKERAAVQVKSEADQTTLDDYIKRTDEAGQFDRFFFVCHSPKGNLQAPASRDDIHLWTGRGLAEAIMGTGLHDWVLERIAQ
jgi:hypothetical protein